jgi:hypothetical protein
MPDWKQIIREHLEMLGLPPGECEDVVTELAAHLEETYADTCCRGLAPSAALEQSLQEVDNWRVLAKNIRRAKAQEDPMNRRTKTFWIPGLASLLSASLLMTLLQRIGVRPRLLSVGAAYMTLYWPWLAALPVFGALGAFLSQRAGGDMRTRLAAASSPVLWLFLLSVPMLPVELAHQSFSPLALVYFVVGMTNWVAIPGCALLLGALPFLFHSPLSAIPSTSHR